MPKTMRPLYLMLCSLAIISLISCERTPPRTQVFTIGILNLRPSLEPLVDTFQAGMADLGYIEGETVFYNYSGPVGNSAWLAREAQKLVTAGVDLIFALGTAPTLAAKDAVVGTAIPVIFAPLNDPVGFGIVKSLTRPGGNLTGISTGGYISKELEWLLKLAPHTKQIFVPHDPADSVSVQSLAILSETAARFKIDLSVHEVHNVTEVLTVATTIAPMAEAILLLPTTLVLEQIDVFIDLAIQRKLPLAAPTIAHVEAGALVAYGSDYAAIGLQVSRLTDKILHGVAPADLPVETAEFYLGINLQTAKAIDLEIPNTLVQQANFIVR